MTLEIYVLTLYMHENVALDYWISNVNAYI